jgi:hypothetical protein
VPIQRSATAFARGTRIAVPVADQEAEPAGVVGQVRDQVAGLLGHPRPGGMGGDPGDVHAATAVLDHDEDVEAAQEDGVNVSEVDREDRVGLCGEELSPRWARTVAGRGRCPRS